MRCFGKKQHYFNLEEGVPCKFRSPRSCSTISPISIIFTGEGEQQPARADIPFPPFSLGGGSNQLELFHHFLNFHHFRRGWSCSTISTIFAGWRGRQPPAGARSCSTISTIFAGGCGEATSSSGYIISIISTIFAVGGGGGEATSWSCSTISTIFAGGGAVPQFPPVPPFSQVGGKAAASRSCDTISTIFTETEMWIVEKPKMKWTATSPSCYIISTISTI